MATQASSGVIQAFVINNEVRAYRTDRTSLTDQDWHNVFGYFERLTTTPTTLTPIPVWQTEPHIADFIFPGARIQTKPLFCRRCDKALIPDYESVYRRGTVNDLVMLLDDRRGMIRQRVSSDFSEWYCAGCGRSADQKENDEEDS